MTTGIDQRMSRAFPLWFLLLFLLSIAAATVAAA